PLPTPPPDAWFLSILHQESVMAKSKTKSKVKLKSKSKSPTSVCADLASMAVRHLKAAGIDAGDATHWVCLDADGGDAAIREFPPHTAGLRQLVAWLREADITTLALEATGVYGHVLFLTLLEAGFHVITTAPTFTRQIKGRPKTDRRDCQWIQ